jgi:YD repeat-containing protein
MMIRLARYCIPKVLWLILCFAALFPGLTRETLCADVAYTYDALNRLISVSYDNGKELHYSYDSAGNILMVEVTAPAAGTEIEAAGADE